MVVDNDEPQNIRSIYVQRGEISSETQQSNRQRSRPSSGSFFAIFYERPVRHRYYRQLNRGATNLVRRLSQSRLFLNSSANNRNQIRRNRQESSNSNAESESQPMHDEQTEIGNVETVDDDDDVGFGMNEMNTVHPAHVSVQSLNIRNETEIASENRLNPIRTVASENDVFGSGERSETPPPPYAVAVVHHINNN